MTSPRLASLTLQDILAVEDHPDMPEVRCPQTGIPLWSMLRVPFLRSIMSDALYGVPMGGQSARVPLKQAVGSLARAAWHNTAHRRSEPTDVVIMATGVGNQWVDGRWFNRLTDHFAGSLPERTLVIEDFFAWRWPFPRHNQRVRFSAPLQAEAATIAKITRTREDRERAASLVDLAATRAKHHLGWELSPAQRDRFTHWLSHKAAAAPWLYGRYRTLLERLRPRILLKEEACYGLSSVLMRAARDLHIPTAEYQHGAVSQGHDAYNLAPALRDSAAYRLTLPDYFLAYGAWWIDQINVPVKGIPIGNPHRSARLSATAPATSGDRSVLVLGDGIETDMYVGLARQLAERLGESFEVVFRPHPLERDAVRTRFASEGTPVRLDPHVDIYDALCKAHAVVSELSTGLFEAAGLVSHIFIWDTSKSRFTFPRHPFAAFSDADDLARQLQQTSTSPWRDEDVAKVWQPDWQTQYRRFLADAAGIETGQADT